MVAVEPTYEVSPTDEWGKSPISFIPKERYTSAEYLQREKELLWPRVWQFVGRVEQIPHPGDWFEYEIHDDSILVVRVDEATIKAYFNSCRHRGSKIRRGHGRSTELRCPYHGWCWNLDGSIREVVDPEDFPGIENADVDLAQCRVDTWGGFVFVTMDPDTETLAEFLDPLPSVEHLGLFRLEEMRFQSHRIIELKVNWKSALDAFTEAYHVAGTHPQSLSRLPYERSVYDVFGRHSRSVIPAGSGPSRRWQGPKETPLEILRSTVEVLVPLELATEEDLALVTNLTEESLGDRSPRSVLAEIRRKRLGPWTEALSETQMIDNWNYFMFPNWNFNLYPGQMFGYRARPKGDDPGKCIFEIISLQTYPDGDAPPYEPQFIADPLSYPNWGLAVEQDIDNLMHCVHQGMLSRSFTGLRLSSYQEKRIRHMHEVLDTYLPTT